MNELLSPPDIGRPTLRLLKDDDARAVERRRLRRDSVHSRFRGGLAGSVLRRIRAYIDAHIGERISLDDLAHQAGVSRFLSLYPGLVRTEMTDQFGDDAPWTPPELAPRLVRVLATGRADRLAGRYIHAEHDDIDALIERADEIDQRDLNAIRLQR